MWIEPDMPGPFRTEGWEQEIACFRWPEDVGLPSVKPPADLRTVAVLPRWMFIPQAKRMVQAFSGVNSTTTGALSWSSLVAVDIC